MNLRGRRFGALHNLVMFVVPPRELDLYYQAAHDVWCEYKCAGSMDILTLVMFSYMTVTVRSETRLEHA